MCMLQQPYAQCSPSGLVTCAQPPAGVPVEIFVEQDQIAPVRVMRESRVISMEGPGAVFIGQEDARESAGKLLGDLLERQHFS